MCTNTTPTFSVSCGSCTIEVNSATICEGESATLTATGATGYLWSTGATTPSITVSPTETTTFTVTSTSGTCTGSAEATVTVNPLPDVPSATVTCNNNLNTITVNSPTGSGFSYQLDNGTFQSSLEFNNVPNGNHTVTVKNSNGCEKSTNVFVICAHVCTIPLTSVLGTNNQTVCLGQPIIPIEYDMTGTGATGVGPGGQLRAGVTATLSSSNVFIFSGTPTQTGVFTYTVNANGSVLSPCHVWVATGTITVSGVEVNSATICAGESATLTATGATGYSWNTGVTTASITVSPATTTTYTVTSSGGQCSGSAEATVTVRPLPVINVTANPSIPQCSGQIFNLTANITNNPAGTTNSYVWSDGLGSNSTVPTPALTVTPPALTANATYTVTGNTTYPTTPTPLVCSSNKTITVTVNDYSACPTFTLGNTSGYTCDLTPIIITGNTITNGTQVTFTKDGFGTISTSPSMPLTSSSTTPVPFSLTYTPVAADVGHTVIITGTIPANGSCPAVIRYYTLNVNTKNLTISVTAVPASLCSGNSTTLTASGATSYVWSSNVGGTTPTVTTPILSNTTQNNTTAIFTVTGTTNNTCGVGTSTVTIWPLPTIAASESTICNGSSATITVNGAATYSAWSPTTNLTGSGKTVVVSPTTNTTYTVTATTSNGCPRTLSIPITVQNCGSCCANTCPWTLSGNSAVNAPSRATMSLASNCTTNNFVGTRGGNAAENNDLVFGSNGSGYMRLTTNGALYLSDNNTPAVGNIRIGWDAGMGPSYNRGTNSIIIGEHAAFNAQSSSSSTIIGKSALENAQGGGNSSILIGTNVARNILSGGTNIFIGDNSGSNSGATPTYGNQNNTCLGHNTGQNISGFFNTFIGLSSGNHAANTNNNTFVGANAGSAFTTVVGSGNGLNGTGENTFNWSQCRLHCVHWR